MEKTQPRNLFVSIATYKALLAASAISFLRRTFDMLLRDYDEAQFTFQWCQIDSQQFSSSLEDVGWERLYHSDPLLWMLISGWREENVSAGRNPAVAGVTVGFSQHRDQPSTLEFSISKELLGSTIGRDLQTEVVALALAVFSEVGGTAGYITVDYVSASVYGSMSPYERAIGLAYPLASRKFPSRVRGYYWGNLLHNDHVRLLGGSNILSQAPAYLVRPIADCGYFLQLTDDINDIDRNRLARLRDYLTPLLPEGIPQSAEYYQALPDFLL